MTNLIRIIINHSWNVIHSQKLICGWYAGDIWIISGWNVDDIWMISGWYVGDIWMISGWNVDEMWMISPTYHPHTYNFFWKIIKYFKFSLKNAFLCSWGCVNKLTQKLGFKKLSLSRVYAPRFNPVDKWISTVEFKSSWSGVLKWIF